MKQTFLELYKSNKAVASSSCQKEDKIFYYDIKTVTQEHGDGSKVGKQKSGLCVG